jgi:predicted esterase
MLRKKGYIFFVAVFWFVFFGGKGQSCAEEVIKGVISRKIFAGGDENKSYFLIGDDFRLRSPNATFGLLIVIPGGDGGEDFNPFVQRIFKNSLSDEYIVAQLLSVKWSQPRSVVWPTERVKAAGQKFSTEAFVKAVIEDVGSKRKLDMERIFTLSWSSGGPAGYAVSLDDDIGVTGSYIAMSVFKPESLAPLESAKGHAYFIDHSPEDKICPFRMAEEAEKLLSEKGAKVKLVTYDGGHGWRGNVYSRIRYGVRWLEKNHAKPKAVIGKSAEGVTAEAVDAEGTKHDYTIIREDFERGEKEPKGWQKGASVKGVSYIWDKETAFKGRGSLCLKKTEQKYFPIGQWFKKFSHDEVSKKLEVKVKVKAQQVSKAIVDVQFTDENSEWLGHEWACYVGARNTSEKPASHDWKDYSGTIAIPKGTKTIIMAFQIYGPGTVWFDELTGAYLPERRTVEKAALPKEDVTDKPAEEAENDDKDGNTNR